MSIAPSSLYIHIPFCIRKCSYCDFVSYQCREDSIEKYTEALIHELHSFPALAPSVTVSPMKTVYIGGGTPSLLSGGQLTSILLAIKETFDITSDAEITMEANPGTVTQESLRAYREAGVNRLSFGVQSLNNDVLFTLGRIHNADMALEAIAMAHAAGFSNISADMMLGIPGQTIEMAVDTATSLINTGITHLSFYSLSLEEGTPMREKYEKSLEEYMPQETERAMVHAVMEKAAQLGFVHYEISNMALPGKESRHNQIYWHGLPYLGFGAGAHAYFEGKRYAHDDTIDAYCANMANPKPSFTDLYHIEEELTGNDEKKEYMMLGFRRIEGISEEAYQERFGEAPDALFADVLADEIKRGLVEKKEGYYRLTAKGIDFGNQVFEDYV